MPQHEVRQAHLQTLAAAVPQHGAEGFVYVEYREIGSGVSDAERGLVKRRAIPGILTDVSGNDGIIAVTHTSGGRVARSICGKVSLG